MRHWEARKHDDCNWTKPWQHRRQTTQPTIIIASFEQEIIRAKIYTKVESEVEAVIMKREDKLHELKERHDKMG